MESSLSLQLSDYAAEVGSFLGYGRTAANWSGWQAASPYVPSSLDLQLGQIMACIQGGLRQFYNPPLEGPGAVAHRWSFLTPERTLTTVAGTGVYDLEDDYGGIIGELTYQSTDSTWLTVKRVGIGEVDRWLQQLFGTQNKPRCCAIVPKQSDGSQGQRFQISFAPLPDAAYTLTYQCQVLPQALSASSPYPYGGAQHGETILESCLAVAESRIQDESGGNHQQRFMERLKASITVDVRNRPAYLGQNLDRSDRMEGCAPWQPWMGTQATGVTYNGAAIP